MNMLRGLHHALARLTRPDPDDLHTRNRHPHTHTNTLTHARTGKEETRGPGNVELTCAWQLYSIAWFEHRKFPFTLFRITTFPHTHTYTHTYTDTHKKHRTGAEMPIRLSAPDNGLLVALRRKNSITTLPVSVLSVSLWLLLFAKLN